MFGAGDHWALSRPTVPDSIVRVVSVAISARLQAAGASRPLILARMPLARRGLSRVSVQGVPRTEYRLRWNGEHPAYDLVDDILSNLFKTERPVLSTLGHWALQPEASHRAAVVHWLASVHETLHMKLDTLFLAVNLFDKYLDKKAVIKSD